MPIESSSLTHTLRVRDYDLAATLDSGQVFRWKQVDRDWEGVVGNRWVRLEPRSDRILATVAESTNDWTWLETFLQTCIELGSIVDAFPDDEPMRRAVFACQGLRLLKQDSWECLASFILSSTKQISQIRQIVARVCTRYGERIPTSTGSGSAFAFPTANRIADCTEQELRDCGMGFRAPYLLAAARAVRSGSIAFNELPRMPIADARAELTQLPGVGRKIADCVLLFTGAQPAAFPVDVWIMKALQRLYFPGRKMSLKQLQEFSEQHFGPHAGYAQQYLFHYMRIHHSDANE